MVGLLDVHRAVLEGTKQATDGAGVVNNLLQLSEYIPNTPLWPQRWYGATALYGCVVVCFLVK